MTVPAMGELVHKGLTSSNPEKVPAAKKPEAKLDEILNSENHSWYIGKLAPEEAARRKKAAAEFKARYNE